MGFSALCALSVLSAALLCAEEEIDSSILTREMFDASKSEELIAGPDRRDHLLARRELNLDQDEAPDTYLEGYIQALVDVHYYEIGVIVVVKDGVVYLYHLPHNDLISNSIITFVSNLPEVKEVKRAEGTPNKDTTEMEQYEVRDQVNGIWFPQSTVLFQPLIANLREPVYSAGFRWDDDVMGKRVIGVSFGDTFPIFRWRHVLPWNGDMQIDIQAGMWAVFNMGHYDNPNGEFSELVTTDYLVGIPLSYAINAWSFRLRIYHISSHLGDEFMFNNPGYPRVNPSMEALEFMSSYQVLEGVRIYFGPGWVIHSDKSYPIDPFYIEYGAECRFFGHRSYYHRIYGTPFFAIDCQNWQQNDWKFSNTYQLGYEWSKLQGVGRKVRLFVQYYHGHSEGQFFNIKTRYWAGRFSYGF